MYRIILGIWVLCTYVNTSVVERFDHERDDILKIEQPRHGNDSEFNVVCYLTMVGAYEGNIPPALNVTFCTHVIFLASGITNSSVDPGSNETFHYYYERVRNIKKLKPGLKIILCNGGQFSEVLESEFNRQKFAQSALPYLIKYGFDGFDLDWEFPAWGSNRQKPEQRHNFTLVLKEIRHAFDNYTSSRGLPKFLVTAAVASTLPLVIGCYEPAEIAQYLDFINLMSYDIHGYSKTTPFTGHNSPLYSGSSILDDTIFLLYNMASAAQLWNDSGLQKSQIMVGIPAYGHTFKLLLKSSHHVYSLAEGYDKSLGDEINRYTICTLLKNDSFTQVWDDECKVPYAYHNETWISYENKTSIIMKVQWIKEHNFGGIMTFSLDSDDFSGNGCGTKWPVHNIIYNTLHSV